MQQALLLTATVLMWVAVIAGTYQRLVEMPRWFARPPASFELIRRQSRGARRFWIPLSASFMLTVGFALIACWHLIPTRYYLLAAIGSFGLTGALSGAYFVKEVIAFTKIPADAPPTPELLARVRFWLRWTSVRDILQLAAAVFVTLAYLRAG